MDSANVNRKTTRSLNIKPAVKHEIIVAGIGNNAFARVLTAVLKVHVGCI